MKCTFFSIHKVGPVTAGLFYHYPSCGQVKKQEIKEMNGELNDLTGKYGRVADGLTAANTEITRMEEKEKERS